VTILFVIVARASLSITAFRYSAGVKQTAGLCYYKYAHCKSASMEPITLTLNLSLSPRHSLTNSFSFIHYFKSLKAMKMEAFNIKIKINDGTRASRLTQPVYCKLQKQ
jgi:hypothetical protein